jgi:hypothetical protein
VLGLAIVMKATFGRVDCMVRCNMFRLMHKMMLEVIDFLIRKIETVLFLVRCHRRSGHV